VNKQMRTMMIGGIATGLILVSGCSSRKPLPLEAGFSQIEVAHSNATDVLNLFPEKEMLHTDHSVSVFHKKGWSSETGVITFDRQYPQVHRLVYVQHRSQIMTEKVFLLIQSQVPPELLQQPYENNDRKNLAVLRFCHEAMIADARPFLTDQRTESLIGLGRTALGIAILQLDKRPREIYKLTRETGFDFDHPTLDKCYLGLKQDAENIYTVALRSKAMVDPLTTW